MNIQEWRVAYTQYQSTVWDIADSTGVGELYDPEKKGFYTLQAMVSSTPQVEIWSTHNDL